LKNGTSGRPGVSVIARSPSVAGATHRLPTTGLRTLQRLYTLSHSGAPAARGLGWGCEVNLEIESAWPKYPDYRIDLIPVEQTVRVWYGDLLLAESTGCLRVEETKHVDRLYVPESDVHWEHFTFAEGVHTVCPFKGQADYWDLTAVDPVESGIAWAYPAPFDEVGGIKSFIAFYQDRTRIEFDERWPGDEPGWPRTRRFPAWGDARDLVRLMDVEPAGPNRFVGPAFGETQRNVVEGGQLLGEAIVAACKTVPNQRVTSGFMTFSKAASFDLPVAVDVEVLRGGRTFSTVEVRIAQDGQFRSGGTFLLGAASPDVIRGSVPMPDVAGPAGAEPLDMGVEGRELRILDGAYDPDPDRIGPPEINAWCRFRDDPGPPYLHAALLAQSTTHWTIAAAMRPHPGFGEAQAHTTLSTGIMSAAIAFHDEFDVREWLLYANPAIYAGRGLAQGEGRVFAQDGRLVASYSVQAMIRAFTTPPGEMGRDATNAM
jgi:acyl-CoA thioesterase II